MTLCFRIVDMVLRSVQQLGWTTLWTARDGSRGLVWYPGRGGKTWRSSRGRRWAKVKKMLFRCSKSLLGPSMCLGCGTRCVLWLAPIHLRACCVCPLTATRCHSSARNRCDCDAMITPKASSDPGRLHQPQPLRHGATRPAFRPERQAFCAARPRPAAQPTGEPLILQHDSAACLRCSPLQSCTQLVS